jgi:hypothetical protein
MHIMLQLMCTQDLEQENTSLQEENEILRERQDLRAPTGDVAAIGGLQQVSSRHMGRFTGTQLQQPRTMAAGLAAEASPAR